MNFAKSISARIGIDYVCNEEKTLGKLISGKIVCLKVATMNLKW